MPDVPESTPNKPIYKIPQPKELSKATTKTDFKAIRSEQIRLKEVRLIQAEKDRLGEEEYQRQLGMRLRGEL